MGDSPSGSKAKDGKRKRKRKEERLNDGDNNGQAMHDACKPHASRLGQIPKISAGYCYKSEMSN